MMRALDDDRWVVHDGMHELAHFLYLNDAISYCQKNDGGPPHLSIRKRDDDRLWTDWK